MGKLDKFPGKRGLNMAKNIDVMFSKETDDWKTPLRLYNAFMQNGYIDTFQYQAKKNELINNYFNKKLFVNPPFSKLKDVSKWVIEQYKLGNTIALLIPARTDTQYFHDLMQLNPLIIFIKGRLHYNESNSAPFPTILLVFRHLLFNAPTYHYMT